MNPGPAEPVGDWGCCPAAELPMTATPFSADDLARLTPEAVADLAARLEADNYDTPFAGLEDWHRLRAIAFQRPELAEPYVHLLDLEAFDEE